MLLIEHLDEFSGSSKIPLVKWENESQPYMPDRNEVFLRFTPYGTRAG